MKTLVDFFKKNIFVYRDVESKSANIALLLLRISAGFTIMMAGLDKLPLPDWMTDQVSGLGFPFPVLFAWMAVFSEFAFGLLLSIGLITSISALILAVTIGVAAFGFHGIIPLVEMHITQYFFWIFILFTFFGAGKYSIDYYLLKSRSFLSNNKGLFVSIFFVLLLSYGLFTEYSKEVVVESKTEATESLNIAGSFNDWNPAANEMTKLSANNYALNVEIKETGLIAFKFTENKTWDRNWGEAETITAGFPLKGKAVIDKGNSTQNINAYIPNPGNYIINFNSETYMYSLDSLKRD